MPSADSSRSIIELERQILSALCGGNIDAADWSRLASRLALQAWSDPEHKVVYDALRAVRSNDANTRREQLPAQATRMGFPDVDWANYFAARESDPAKIDQLIDRLGALGNR